VRIVYAKATTVIMTSLHGASILVNEGSHWPGDDPLVRSHPDLFSEDPRTGLAFSVQPAEELIELGGEQRGRARK